MRIVAGELRGRRLRSPPRGASVRPTSDRVREALFALLGERVRGATVLDLFCGTGALAIEALSRGAERATLVDDDITHARRNLDSLGLGGRTTLVRSDAERFLRRDRGRYDLILCDPPYTLADRLRGTLDSLIAPHLTAAGLAVVESASRSPLRLGLELRDERTYGDTHLAIYRGDDG